LGVGLHLLGLFNLRFHLRFTWESRKTRSGRARSKKPKGLRGDVPPVPGPPPPRIVGQGGSQGGGVGGVGGNLRVSASQINAGDSGRCGAKIDSGVGDPGTLPLGRELQGPRLAAGGQCGSGRKPGAFGGRV